MGTIFYAIDPTHKRSFCLGKWFDSETICVDNEDEPDKHRYRRPRIRPFNSVTELREALRKVKSFPPEAVDPLFVFLASSPDAYVVGDDASNDEEDSYEEVD